MKPAEAKEAARIAPPVGPSGSARLEEAPRRRPIERVSGLRGAWIRHRATLSNVVNFTIFFGLWEAIGRSGRVSKLILPPFTEIILQTVRMAQSGELARHLTFSATNFAVGFLLAVVTGIPLGLALGASRFLDRVFGPYVWALYSTPRLALLPIITITLGFGMASKVLLVYIAAFFIIVINTAAGVKTVEQSLVRAARVFCASRLKIFTRVVVPYTLPFIVAGLRLSITNALVVTLVSEMIASSRGMGYVVMRAVDEFNSAKLWSMIFILVAASMTLVALLRRLESWVAPWREVGGL